MITFICLFFPALVSEYVITKTILRRHSVVVCVSLYASLVMGINGIILFAVDNISCSNISMKLENNGVFAAWYMIGATTLGVMFPLLVNIVMGRNEGEQCLTLRLEETKRQHIYIYIYAGLLVFVNFTRIFDNNFWGDEAFSIRLSKMSFLEMINATANDVHPPLYYFILMITTKILGHHGWVYHLTSLFPYVVLVAFALIVVLKRFGKGASVLFVTLISVSQTAFTENLEVRMYSLSFMFVFFSFYALLLVIEKKSKGYVLFVIASLGAAYSHYYALFSVCFFYFALLVWTLKGKETIRRLIFVYLCTILGYLPWIFFMLRTFYRTSRGFWITDFPGVIESLGYYYYSGSPLYSYGMFLVTIISFLFVMCRDMGMVRVLNENGKKVVSVFLNSELLSPELLWGKWGVISSVGLLFVGEAISLFVEPSFLKRYLFPVVGVFWMVLCMSLSKLRSKRIIISLIILFALLVNIPDVCSTQIEDKATDRLIRDTQFKMNSCISEDDVMLTNGSHLDWTILDYYFPGIEHEYVSAGYDKFEDGVDYWLLWNKPLTEKEIGWLKDEGFFAKERINNGCLGGNEFILYSLSPVNRR